MVFYSLVGLVVILTGSVILAVKVSSCKLEIKKRENQHLPESGGMGHDGNKVETNV